MNNASARLAQHLLDSCMCHKTRMAARAITRAYDDALRQTGLRATQLAVLAAVGARGALSIQSLADVLGMDRTTLTRNLRPLEDKGLVLLAPEARHRARMLELTAGWTCGAHQGAAAVGRRPAHGQAAARRSSAGLRCRTRSPNSPKKPGRHPPEPQRQEDRGRFRHPLCAYTR